MMPDLRQKCRAFINSETLVLPGDHLLVAVSGGPDSMVLTDILRQEFEAVALVHCHFGLRAEADAETELVRAYAETHGLLLHTQHFDVAAAAQPGESMQMVARRLRYAFFEELCDSHGYGRVATAHHRDDQVETLMASFFRGRQPRLLQGIPLRRDQYVRPLLFASKVEIMAYAETENVPYAIDASNLGVKYQRNSVRNELLPALEKLNPSFRERLLEQYAEQELQFDFMEMQFRSAEDTLVRKAAEGAVVDLEAAEALWPGQFLPLYIGWLAHQWGFSGQEALQARSLLDAETGARFVGRAGEMVRDRETIVFLPQASEKEAAWSAVEIRQELPERLLVPLGKRELVIAHILWQANLTITHDPQLHLLDVAALKFPLTIRPPQQGDRMQPLGMQGRKLLSDIMNNAKYTLQEKRAAFVVADVEEVVFLSGFRIAEKAKITQGTRDVLQLRIQDRDRTT